MEPLLVPARHTRRTVGQHLLVLVGLCIAQVASNGLLPGLGILFLFLLATPWFRRRSDRIVLVAGAVVSAVFLASLLLDLVVGPSMGYRFH